MKRLKWVILFVLILSIIFLVTYYACYYHIYKVNLTIIGDSYVKVLYDTEYKDLGATANVCALKKCKNITDSIKVINNINTSVIGEYKVEYTLEYNGKKYKKIRDVFVYEDEKPVINLTGGTDVKICPNKDYYELGYSATDNYDGDITDKVFIEYSGDKVTYSVSDYSENSTKVTRNLIREDKEKPVINLKGKKNISIYAGNKYNEPGYEAKDNCDENITNKVKVTNGVNTNVKGTYTIKYEVSDSSGNVSTATRTVNVYDFNVNSYSEYIKSLENYINEKNYQVSIGYYNINRGYTYTYNAGTVYYGASLVKTVDAIYAYEKLNLTSEIRDLVSRAISVSDNDAHKKLVDMIGRDNLKNYADRVIGTKNFLNVRTSFADYYGNTTVYDQMAIMRYLYKVINNNINGDELKSYFINSYGAYLRFTGCPLIMHKYGKTNQYYHDVGIVLANSPYVVVILTTEGYNDVQKIISDLSSKIYKFNSYIDG